MTVRLKACYLSDGIRVLNPRGLQDRKFSLEGCFFYGGRFQALSASDRLVRLGHHRQQFVVGFLQSR